MSQSEQLKVWEKQRLWLEAQRRCPAPETAVCVTGWLYANGTPIGPCPHCIPDGRCPKATGGVR